jgi:hypothetical protein
MIGDDPLQRLRDVHLPDAPAWFPPAPGWWLLATVVIVALAFGIVAQRRRRRRRAPFRTATGTLEDLARGVRAGSSSPADYAHAASAVLKRLIVHVLRRRDAAALTGAQWLALLDALSARGDSYFTRGAGAILGTDRFAPGASCDLDTLHAAVTALITRMEQRT